MFKITIRVIMIKKLNRHHWFFFFNKLKKKRVVRFKLRRLKKNFKKVKPVLQFNIYRLRFNERPKYTRIPVTNKIKRIIKQKTISFYFIQQSFKSTILLIFNSRYKLIQNILTNKILEDFEAFRHLSLISTRYKKEYNIVLYIKLKHSNFLKKLNIVLEQLNNINLIRHDRISIFALKPNFFFINLQYKKIKSIKKSRKKLMYLSLKKK